MVRSSVRDRRAQEGKQWSTRCTTVERGGKRTCEGITCGSSFGWRASDLPSTLPFSGAGPPRTSRPEAQNFGCPASELPRPRARIRVASDRTSTTIAGGPDRSGRRLEPKPPSRRPRPSPLSESRGPAAAADVADLPTRPGCRRRRPWRSGPSRRCRGCWGRPDHRQELDRLCRMPA
jgi:hypothetical protein